MALTPWLAAAGSDSAATDFVDRSWLVDDGLPHNVVNRVVQDSAGYLWLATGAGLTRFDGREFKQLPERLREGGMNLNVRDLAADGPGSLLMLPASGGVIRYKEGRIESHPVSDAVTGKSLVDLFVEPNGTLWLGTEEGTIIRWQAGEIKTFGAKEGLNRRGNRFSFALDREGRVWVAGGDFIGVYNDGRLQPVPEVKGNSVTIAPSRDGSIWISTFERLLKWEDGHLWTVAEAPNWPVARGTVHYLYEDRDGALWIATRRDGLFRLSAGKLSLVPTSTPMIASVTQDRERNIWVSTEGGGVERLQPKAFVLIDRSAGLKEDVSTSVAGDAHGALWCANRNGGLVRYFEGKSEVIAASPEGTEFFAIAVCPDRDDHIWVSMRSGLYRVAATKPFAIEKMSDLTPGRVLFCARSGDPWVGTGNGELGFFHDGKYRQVTADAGTPEKRIAAIAEGARDGVWIALRDGDLLTYNDERLTLRLQKTLPQRRINTLYVDHLGNLWIGTPKGLGLLRGSQLKILTTTDGLPDDYIDQIIEDNQERLWIGSRRGLYNIPLADLIARADETRPPVSGTTFGKDEGLARTTSFSGEQPGTSKTADGRLWFTTYRGIVGMNTTVLSRDRLPPPVYIDEVRVDGRVESGTIRIPPGNHRIDFHFVALNFSAPEKVRIRHQLIGVDSDWIETISEHTATYARVPPGEYRMQAVAGDQDGMWGTHPATLTIIAQAAWWQTKEAFVVILLSFTGLVVWAARYWSHRRLKRRLDQLERENALERERARIARDLHDELGGSLTQIRLLAERLKRHNEQPEAGNLAVQLVWRARRLAGELESIIWTVSPKNNTWDRLASFIGRFAIKFFRDTTIRCTLSDVDVVPALPLRPEEQHSLLAVAKEAFNNILKHSRATRATVSFSIDVGVLTLAIQDDGVGFNPDREELSACNGLNNMRARLREIGGEIRIESHLGEGTTIIVRHRLSSSPPKRDRALAETDGALSS